MSIFIHSAIIQVLSELPHEQSWATWPGVYQSTFIFPDSSGQVDIFIQVHTLTNSVQRPNQYQKPHSAPKQKGGVDKHHVCCWPATLWRMMPLTRPPSCQSSLAIRLSECWARRHQLRWSRLTGACSAPRRCELPTECAWAPAGRMHKK
jgi:hypothetical protein